MMTMNHLCNAIQEQLSEYIDGELDGGLCAAIQAHLADCDDCRVLVDTLRKTILLYRQQSSAAMPSEVQERLYQVLHLESFLGNRSAAPE